MKYSTKILAIVTLLVLTVTSCKEDYFDLEAYQAMVKGHFPVSDVDPQHTWETMGTANAHITVLGDMGNIYKVKVYEDNPLTNNVVTVLYSGSAISGSTINTQFTYPLSKDQVFIGLFDNAGRRLIEMVPIEDRTIEATVGVGNKGATRTTRAIESDYSTSYAKTFEQMLNPTKEYIYEYIDRFQGTSYNYIKNEDRISSVNTVTLDQMKAYTTFTDADLTQDKYQTLNNEINIPGTQGGEQNYNTIYAIEEGYSPANGTTVTILCEGNTVGTLTFGGSGTAAVSDASQNYNGFSARIARDSYTFTAAKTGTLSFYHVVDGNNKRLSIKKDGSYMPTGWYEGSYYQELQWWNTNIDIYVEAGHSYQVFFEYGQQMELYGLKFNYKEIVEGTPATTKKLGDGKHFRVDKNTEINQIFHANATYGVINDIVIYVEGKIHLKGNTLNGVTLVVANNAELIIDDNTNFSNCGRLLIMAGGKVTGTKGKYLYVNNGMPNYNAGTINLDNELNLNGSDFYNCGTVNVDKLRNTSGGRLTNFGSITARCNEGAADAYNCIVVNGCYMHYTEEAGIGLLTMLNNSRLDIDGKAEFTQSWSQADVDTSNPSNVKNLTVNEPNILMDKSVVNVGTAYFTNSAFEGPSNDNEYAILKMQKVEVGNGTDLIQRGNCILDWNITELYNKQGEKYQDVPAEQKEYNKYAYLVDYYRDHLTKFVTEATAPSYITIPAGNCTGVGYNPDGNTGGEEPNDKPFSLRYCFEDNFPEVGDYDFNDAVITVTPTINNNVVTLSVSLDAVGATKQIAAALRIVGLTDADVEEITCTGFMDENFPTNQSSRLINATEPRLTADQKYVDDVVLLLFNNAHWSLGNQINSIGGVFLGFINTVERTNAFEPKLSDVTPRVATYTIVLKDAAKASLFVQNNLDVFIVEGYNGGNWEVHTVRFKYDEVISDYPKKNLRLTYGDDNMPWAVCVPGNSFRYPIEWTSITVAYPFFSNWASNQSSNTDWYEHYEEEKVY
jgi:LruC domain-containing protein